MKNWTIKDYQKDTVSTDLFILCRMLGQDREECVVETLAICAFPNPGQECKIKKTGARSLKKQEPEMQPNPPEFWQKSKLRMNLHDHNWY